MALRRVGLLRYDPTSGIYSLGPRVIELAATALSGLGCGHLVAQINHPLLQITKRGALQSFEAFAPLDVSVYPAAIVIPVGETK